MTKIYFGILIKIKILKEIGLVHFQKQIQKIKDSNIS